MSNWEDYKNICKVSCNAKKAVCVKYCDNSCELLNSISELLQEQKDTTLKELRDFCQREVKNSDDWRTIVRHIDNELKGDKQCKK